MRKRIGVIDGQGGGIGKALIKSLKASYGETIEVWGLGTNAIATGQMLKAGANRGATGESAIVWSVRNIDLIIGVISISWANAMLGEVTPAIAQAIMSADAPKIFLTLTQENVQLIGLDTEPLPHMVNTVVKNKVREVFYDV